MARGRPSKLSPSQWSALRDRLAQGESVSKLSKEFGIARSRISERLSESVEKIKSAAHQLVEVDETLKALPLTDRMSAINLAERLKSISNSLAGAAEYGAKTAHRLAAMAHTQADALDDYDPMSSPDTLKSIAVLSEMANSASQTGLNLLRANKEAVDDINKHAVAPEPITEIEVVIVDPKDRNATGIHPTSQARTL